MIPSEPARYYYCYECSKPQRPQVVTVAETDLDGQTTTDIRDVTVYRSPEPDKEPRVYRVLECGHFVSIGKGRWIGGEVKREMYVGPLDLED